MDLQSFRKRKKEQVSDSSSYKPGTDKVRFKLIAPPPFDEERILLLSLVDGFSFLLVMGLRDKERESAWSSSSSTSFLSRYSFMQDLDFCKEHMVASISLALRISIVAHGALCPCTCHRQSYIFRVMSNFICKQSYMLLSFMIWSWQAVLATLLETACRNFMKAYVINKTILYYSSSPYKYKCI